jgi:hypothetical protein
VTGDVRHRFSRSAAIEERSVTLFVGARQTMRRFHMELHSIHSQSVGEQHLGVEARLGDAGGSQEVCSVQNTAANRAAGWAFVKAGFGRGHDPVAFKISA